MFEFAYTQFLLSGSIKRHVTPAHRGVRGRGWGGEFIGGFKVTRHKVTAKVFPNLLQSMNFKVTPIIVFRNTINRTQPMTIKIGRL